MVRSLSSESETTVKHASGDGCRHPPGRGTASVTLTTLLLCWSAHRVGRLDDLGHRGALAVGHLHAGGDRLAARARVVHRRGPRTGVVGHDRVGPRRAT